MKHKTPTVLPLQATQIANRSVNATLQDEALRLVGQNGCAKATNVVDANLFNIALQKWVTALGNQYKKAFTEKFELPTKKDIETMDTLDLSNCFNTKTEENTCYIKSKDYNEEELDAFINNNKIAAYIPPFPKLILKLGKHPIYNTYCELKSVDIKRNLIEIRIVNFFNDYNYRNIIHAIIDASNDNLNVLIQKDSMVTYDMFRALSPIIDCKWNAADLFMWNRHYIEQAEEIEARNLSLANKKDKNELLVYYITSTLEIIAYCNYLMSKHRTSNQTKQIIYDDDLAIKYEPKQTNKVKQTFGNLTITTPLINIEPIYIRNVTYKTPTWNRRGHIRKLKNGTTTYVNACTNIRHNLQKYDVYPAQKIMEFYTEPNN